MKIFQILNGRCHWQTPFTSLAETVGKFPPDCLFVEAPDYVNEQWGFDETQIGDDRFIKPTAPDGWVYDDETGHFYPEGMLEQLLIEAQNSKQGENNNLLSKFLTDHPLTWSDGKQYGVTLADQQEIALNLQSYQIAMSAGEESPTLEWHAIHEACVPWTVENLTALSLAIRSYVYPWYTLNQSYKEQIYAAETVKTVESINLEYKTEEEKAAENKSDDLSNTEGEDAGIETPNESNETTESDATA